MISDSETTVEHLKSRVRKFVRDRCWEKYHNPKDLAISISIEAAELLELFQWRSIDEVCELLLRSDFKEKIADELADIVIYCLSMANAVGIDLSSAIINKLAKCEVKYPIERYRGELI